MLVSLHHVTTSSGAACASLAGKAAISYISGRRKGEKEWERHQKIGGHKDSLDWGSCHYNYFLGVIAFGSVLLVITAQKTHTLYCLLRHVRVIVSKPNSLHESLTDGDLTFQAYFCSSQVIFQDNTNCRYSVKWKDSLGNDEGFSRRPGNEWPVLKQHKNERAYHCKGKVSIPSSQ